MDLNQYQPTFLHDFRILYLIMQSYSSQCLDKKEYRKKNKEELIIVFIKTSLDTTHLNIGTSVTRLPSAQVVENQF